ncbi:MAG: helix-turn-helix domain-containing protein [Chitinophagaceae bacterium]
MVTTSEIAASHVLAPFVRCYSYRELDTKGVDLIKPWHASHEVTMPFCLNARPLQFSNCQKGLKRTANNYGGVIGSATRYNGELTFNGRYVFFEVNFRPSGFNKIFGLPSGEITNRIIHAEDILGAGVKRLFEQLCTAEGLEEMAALAETYLLGYLKKQKLFDSNDRITSISNRIISSSGTMRVENLAYDANMSNRSFERHFTAQIGLSPKLFCCISRFSHALALKLKNPEMDWISITNQCGYFDQMHLIKDFKRFSGNTPSHFVNRTPLASETYTNRVDA